MEAIPPSFDTCEAMEMSSKDLTETNRSASDSEVIRATINLDIMKALRKFTNKNTMLVAKALRTKNSLTFGELQKETNLSANILNHTLHEMKKTDLVIQVDKQYYLTKYCVVLLDAISRLRTEVKRTSLEGEDLFAPATQ